MTESHEPPPPLAMRMGRLTLIFIIVVALGVAVAPFLIGREGAPATAMEGETAPEVVIAGFDGSEWRLSDHLRDDGRPVVLNLWASWCGPCRAEIPELGAYASSTPGVMVVGAAVEDREPEARALAEELAPAYLMGMDPTGSLRERYLTPGLPATFVIDGKGVLRAVWFGPITEDGLVDLVGPLTAGR
jgi:cytochrome c biogenesis protein CcmG, thiol:disulfide interchange protein DsbE